MEHGPHLRPDVAFVRKYPPTIPEVRAAGSGAGAGGVISLAVVWLLGCWVWGASWSADKATDALAAVPFPINALIVATFAKVGGWLSGWLAHHSPAPPIPEPMPPDPPPPPPSPDAGIDLVTAELPVM